MHALVIGFGVSGRAAAKLLLELGYSVVAVDKNANELRSQPEATELLNKGVILLSEQDAYPHALLNLTVLSPGIPPNHPWCEQSRRRGVEPISEIELAARFIHRPYLGITGTNGKTTVTLLTSHILNHLGVPSSPLGNSGVCLSTAYFATDPSEVIALELSSYQLETTSTPCLQAAVILNITPDHLDRYVTMAAYARAKMKIFDLVKGGGECWIHESIPHKLPAGKVQRYGKSQGCDLRIDGRQVFYKEKVAFLLPKMYEEGFRHDVENIMAAYALCRPYCKSGEEFVEGLLTFQKPPHRLQYVRTWNGIDFYNDSKGTNIDAVVRAVEAINRPIVLIAGGVDKKTGYAPWIPAFQGRVKGVCVIGQAANNINDELSEHYLVKQFGCLRSAVEGAVQLAEQGDVVLLSPGCASMDMFKDYVDRGNQFVMIVNNL
jgi:UDP-N-acetylmuramoylalanine--D-glutamate ligase